MSSIGVVGYAAPTGIGYLSRRLTKCLDAVKWLVPPHNAGNTSGPEDSKVTYLPTGDARATTILRGFLDGLDSVISVERQWPMHLFPTARAMGVRTVLLVMGEWLEPRTAKQADVLVAPTKMCYHKLVEWGFKNSAVYVPMPLDLDEFPAREPVHDAHHLIFCNGWGGVDERKGGALIREVLTRDHCLLEVRSQRVTDWPTGTCVTPPADTPAKLYLNADACVQPSKWEGLGLQQLEAMACGLPVLTTNAPPMNEHALDAYGSLARNMLCPCVMTERVISSYPWPVATCDVPTLYKMIRNLRGSMVYDYSIMGMHYIRDYHGVKQWQMLKDVCDGSK